MEQHRSVCSLELVCCEMREFGCSAVVLRKDLATHMRESELQHLTGMAVLNLRLTRQLQQEVAEQRQLQTEMSREITEHKQETKKELTELRGQIQQVHNTTQHIEEHTTGLGALCEVLTFGQYSQRKGTGEEIYSDPFYSHQHSYKFKLRIKYYGGSYNDIGAYLHLLTGEYDDQLPWPVNVTVRLELLNQAGDHHHVERTRTWTLGKGERDGHKKIDTSLMKYSDLEERGDGVQYMMNNCLKFRLHLTVQAA